MQSYNFTIEGITPLLMHANDIDARDKIEARRKKLKGGKSGDDRSPPETWHGYVYRSAETGNVCMPAENLLTCLLTGGMKCKVGGKETLKTHSQRIGFSKYDFDLLVGPERQPIPVKSIDRITGEFSDHITAARDLGFRLHVKPVTVTTSKHIRVRPLFSSWAIAGSFEIEEEDATILSLSVLRDLFSTSGRLSGLGDWRPSAPKRPGQYGRFLATVERAS
jgi:hypothetical protein